MSDDFQVGDVVVCVDRSLIQCLRASHDGSRAPAVGSLLRVAAIGVADDVPCGCRCVYAADGQSGLTARFRKLPRADEQFTEQMRACKPTRVGAPA